MGDLEQRARAFATEAHGRIDQRRKYTGEPYIEHPAAVAELVRSVPHTEEMIAAAWLHDVVEDTGVSLHAIRERFGDAVAQLVDELTDVSQPTDGNRAVRKAKDLEHIAKASPAAKTVKLADLIDNFPQHRRTRSRVLESLHAREGPPSCGPHRGRPRALRNGADDRRGRYRKMVSLMGATGVNEHRWGGWPGNRCVDCGDRDQREVCVETHDVSDCAEHVNRPCPRPYVEHLACSLCIGGGVDCGCGCHR